MQVIKNIRLKFGNIMLCFIISILCFSNVSALTAEETVNFNFTFNPSLSISLSSDALVIENLVPGNYANSNTISINAQTNNRNGYTLTAEVGDSETAALANNSLVNTIFNTTFTSIANNASTALASFAPNYWGYTTSQSIDSSTKYSGLLYGTTTTLNQTVDPSGRAVGNYRGGTVTNFTIGASAGSDQTSGEYTNIISFNIVPNVSTDITIESLKYLQDITKLNHDQRNSVLTSMTEDQQYTLTDIRDNKTYTVARLKDGNIWMTQNLDLCIGCSGTTALNSTNTDLNSNLGSTAGYFTSNGIITWTPAGNATVTGTPAQITNFASGNPANSVTGWTNSDTAPYMATGSLHEQTGNYYNYTAAIAMNDSSSISADYTVAPNSICPAGWRLPNGLTQTGGTVNISDFNTLFNAYGIAAGNDTTSNQNVGYATGGFAKMETAPLKFARSGGVSGTTLYSYTTDGRYWSSTAYSSTYSYRLNYNSGALYPANWGNRYSGWSVRCMLR